MADDVAVIGAGVLGLAVAYELARRGRPVHLVERRTVAAGVSGASLAALTQHLAGPPDEVPFLMNSVTLWAELAARLRAETGIDIELDRCGQIRLIDRAGIAGQAELQSRLMELEAAVEAEARAGLDVQLLRAAELQSLLPLLDPSSVEAASWCPGDAKLNALLACWALAIGARRRGVRLYASWPVDEIEPGPPAWRLKGPRGTLQAEQVVIAAGPWTGQLLARLNPLVAASVRPKKAQCCATERLPPAIWPVVATFSVGISEGYTQLHQTRHGEILFNTVVSPSSSQWDAGACSVEPHFLTTSAATLVRLFPALGRARLLRAWAAYEGWTPDHRLLLGPVPDLVGLFVAAGDSGTGFVRAPLAASILADLIDGTTPGYYLPAYQVDRFLGDRRELHG